MITAVEGVRVGHWTDPDARTGCTVALFPEGTVASGEIRGGAPATRDFGLLEPGRLVERVDAVVLSGGSAFGLAAADGVVAELEARGVGFETAGGRVPIVVGMSLYDLAQGDGSVRPTPAEGRTATLAATAADVTLGPVGAGTGASVSKWRGPDHVRQAGLGGVAAHSGDLVVAALMAVNASGDIDDGTTNAAILAGTFELPDLTPLVDDAAPVENTTIGIVATNAILSKVECHLVAQSAHDGFARALVPAHLSGDGDAVVAAATGQVEAPLNLVRAMATAVVEAAIRSSVD